MNALRIAALLLAAGCAAVQRKPTDLVVASDLDNRPFAWVDEHGEPQGRDVEMMQLLARELGRPLVWKRMPFEELLPACERGDVDVVCATLGITEERAKRVLFTCPYFVTEIAVVVRTGVGEPRSLAELAGRRVAASPGTTSEDAVRARVPGSIAIFEGSKAAGPIAQRLASRSIDAAVMDGPAAAALVTQSSGALAVMPEPLAVERYALALPKNRVELCAQLEALLTKLEPQLRALDRRFCLQSDHASSIR